MPKEVTHWLVAEEIAKGMAGTWAGEASLAFPNSRALGAVFPDVMFYAVGKNAIYAHYYHGLEGRDTNYLLRRVAAKIKGKSLNPWLSFLVGIASHIAADQVFHPLVYYLTGDYEARDKTSRTEAIIAHRKFECLLDIFFAGRAKLRRMKLKTFTAGLELPLEELATLDDAISLAFPRALKNYVRLQNVFTDVLVVGMFSLLTPVLPDSLKKISALFYHRTLDGLLPSLSVPIYFRHPVTGEEAVVSVKELFTQAVEKGRGMVEEITRALIEETPVLTARGLSLSFGVEGEPLYFSPQKFFGGKK